MYYPAGGQTYTLGSSISSTDTSILLSSFLEPVTETPYTMALLNTDIVYATIAPRTSSSEFISFTGITQNANGTATLTGVTRGLAKKYPFTTDSSYKLPHAGQSQFILSDAPQVFVKYGALDNDEVITGQWEAPDPLTAQGLVTRDWILALINGGAISQDALVEAGTAGETVVAGNLLYFSETDNEWLKTDADTLGTVMNVKLGIAQGAGVNGGAISGGVLTRGTYTTSGLTQGDLVYASNTAGAFTSGTAGTVPRVIGIAKDATTLYFDPDFQNRLYDYAVDSVGTDAYAVTMPGALSVPFVGMEINFKAGTANTGACTLAVNGGSALAIVRDVSTALVTGDILQNQIVKVIYNGTAWQMMSPLGGTVANASNPVINVYTSDGTWTKPAGLKYIVVEVVGGGGGGGGTTNNLSGQGGGGGGGYSREVLSASALGATEEYDVGAGGAAGTGSSGSDGGTGGTSNFGTTPFLQATGGAGGVGGASSAIGAGGVGGVGSNGTLNIEGQDGSAGFAVTGIGFGGAGGSSHYGGGARGVTTNSGSNGVAGNIYGGGGSGAANDDGASGDVDGGAGAAGVVIVTEYYS